MLEPWTVESLTAAFNEVLAAHDSKLGKLAQPVRVAVTGGTASPGIFEVLEVLGRERTLARARPRARAHFLTTPDAVSIDTGDRSMRSRLIGKAPDSGSGH